MAIYAFQFLVSVTALAAVLMAVRSRPRAEVVRIAFPSEHSSAR